MLQLSQLLEMALSRDVHPKHLREVCEDEACDRRSQGVQGAEGLQKKGLSGWLMVITSD